MLFTKIDYLICVFCYIICLLHAKARNYFKGYLKNAPILILDEAISAAEPENQIEIDKAIENLRKGKLLAEACDFVYLNYISV